MTKLPDEEERAEVDGLPRYGGGRGGGRGGGEVRLQPGVHLKHRGHYGKHTLIHLGCF